MDVNHANDSFHWQGISILQRETVFKIGTDSLLLGTWVPRVSKIPDVILDAGTGVGVLALIMAKHFPNAKIHAIDVDESAVQLAQKNIEANQQTEKILVRAENIFDQQANDISPFDLVVSNPPFYTSHNPSSIEHLARAKHSSVPVRNWVVGLANRAHQQSSICIIVPAKTAADWIAAANEVGFYNQHRMDVFSYAKDQMPVRSLLHFRTSLIQPVFSSIILYEDGGIYTEQYLEMTKIGLQNHQP